MEDMTVTPLVDAGLYESALVYSLPREFGAAVEEWRRCLPASVRETQLVPHLTLCFLGWMRGWQLRALLESFVEHRPKDQTVVLGMVGCFRHRGVIRNIHVEVVRDPDLHAAHRAAHAVGARLPWFDPGRYVLDGYTPHISLLDGADQPESVLENTRPWWEPGDSVVLAHPHVIGKRLDPTVLFEWKG